MNKPTVSVDIVIFGGGIAGLWALNCLRNLGYQAILLETQALGSGQTIKSQGIIHGGIKYALTGFLSGSANAIETMPQRWKNALQGKGEIDLQTVTILSPHQLLWSTGSLSSEIASFLASKALNSRVQKLKVMDYPLLLQNTAFKGHVYRLEEIVLDTISLIATLADLQKNYLFKINSNQGYKFSFESDNPQNILSLDIFSGNERLSLQAKRYLWVAGEGNESLNTFFPKAPLMQKRPLQMVLVKLKTPFSFFAHCIDQGINPRITITTHFTKEGESVWYLGGQIAEEGVHRTQAEQIQMAKKELTLLFPWLDLKEAEWASFFVNRAEPKQLGGKRPDTAYLETVGNVMIGWPTKLALSPMLSDEIIKQLRQQGIYPSERNIEPEVSLACLEKPKVASPPWEEEFKIDSALR